MRRLTCRLDLYLIMTHRAALAFLGAACGPLLAALVLGGTWGVWTLAILGGLFPVALAALGAAGREETGWWSRGPGWALVALGLLAAGGAAAVLLTSGQPAATGTAASQGLPPAGRWLIGALWLAPLALSVTAYAATFGRWGVREDDVERVRRAAREVSELEDQVGGGGD